jgi:hypothetical protein
MNDRRQDLREFQIKSFEELVDTLANYMKEGVLDTQTIIETQQNILEAFMSLVVSDPELYNPVYAYFTAKLTMSQDPAMYQHNFAPENLTQWFIQVCSIAGESLNEQKARLEVRLAEIQSEA